MRWVQCPIIGDGTPDIIGGSESTTGPYRPKISLYGGDWSTLIPANIDGTPTYSWCICIVSDTVAAGAIDDTEVIIYPDIALEDTVTPDMIVAGRGTVDQPNLTAWITLGENVDNNGQQIDAAFTSDWLKIG